LQLEGGDDGDEDGQRNREEGLEREAAARLQDAEPDAQERG